MKLVHATTTPGVNAGENEKIVIVAHSDTMLSVQVKEEEQGRMVVARIYLDPDQVREQIAALTEWLAKADAAEAERTAAHFA
jgi:Holliday junction resolvase-like predicted endonuclease